jgi:hypothetical protein
MKQFAKKLLRPAYDAAGRLIRNSVAVDRIDRESYSQQMQRNILNQYIAFRLGCVAPYPTIRDAGFRVYSQFDEDGIILYVLSMIGFKTRRVVEMCCGGGNECMATNLILNHGFDGYLFDGDENNISNADAFFKSKQDCLFRAPILTQAWITAENVNELLVQCDAAGEVDIFSLDIDGNDYWVWNAIKAINPRLLVFETNTLIPADKSLTIKYRPDFIRANNSPVEQEYLGASPLAMQKLCKQRGYRLIGAHRVGFNLFFLREDEGTKFFPEVTVAEIYDNNQAARWDHAKRWRAAQNMPWQAV